MNDCFCICFAPGVAAAPSLGTGQNFHHFFHLGIDLDSELLSRHGQPDAENEPDASAKTREILELVPETEVETIERCSGHDGTYAVKKEFHEISMKICRPVTTRVEKAAPDHYTSDCPMAGHQIENGHSGGKAPEHPLKLLRMAYGI